MWTLWTCRMEQVAACSPQEATSFLPVCCIYWNFWPLMLASRLSDHVRATGVTAAPFGAAGCRWWSCSSSFRGWGSRNMLSPPRLRSDLCWKLATQNTWLDGIWDGNPDRRLDVLPLSSCHPCWHWFPSHPGSHAGWVISWEKKKIQTFRFLHLLATAYRLVQYIHSTSTIFWNLFHINQSFFISQNQLQDSPSRQFLARRGQLWCRATLAKLYLSSQQLISPGIVW